MRRCGLGDARAVGGCSIQVGGSPVAVAAGVRSGWRTTPGHRHSHRPRHRRVGVSPHPRRKRSRRSRSDGRLRACGDDSIWRIDPATGRAARPDRGRRSGRSRSATALSGATSASTAPGTPRSRHAGGGSAPIEVGEQPGDVVASDGRAWVANSATAPSRHRHLERGGGEYGRRGRSSAYMPWPQVIRP
jgi:hypothetical protein